MEQHAAAATPPPEQADLANLGEHARGLAASAGQWAEGLLGVLALEARRAGLSLAGMLFAALAASFSVLAMWLLLQAALAIGLTRLGADLLWVVAALAVVNGAASLLLLMAIRRLSRHLMFRVTRQALFESVHETAEPRD